MGDARGQQPEGRLLFLLHELRLRLLQFDRSLANPLFEQPLIVLQLAVELSEPAAGRLEQAGQRHAAPGAPTQQNQREQEGRHVLPATEFRAERQAAEAHACRANVAYVIADEWRIAHTKSDRK